MKAKENFTTQKKYSQLKGKGLNSKKQFHLERNISTQVERKKSHGERKR